MHLASSCMLARKAKYRALYLLNSIFFSDTHQGISFFFNYNLFYFTDTKREEREKMMNMYILEVNYL